MLGYGFHPNLTEAERQSTNPRHSSTQEVRVNEEGSTDDIGCINNMLFVQGALLQSRSVVAVPAEGVVNLTPAQLVGGVLLLEGDSSDTVTAHLPDARELSRYLADYMVKRPGHIDFGAAFDTTSFKLTIIGNPKVTITTSATSLVPPLAPSPFGSAASGFKLYSRATSEGAAAISDLGLGASFTAKGAGGLSIGGDCVDIYFFSTATTLEAANWLICQARLTSNIA